MWRLTSSRRKHHESPPRQQARTGCSAPFECRERHRNLARSRGTKHVPGQLFTTVYPTGSEAMLHAVESVPHGRTRRRARAAGVCERAGHQVVVEGFAEARQGS